MKTGRGEYGRNLAKKNRATIKKWLNENKDGTITGCMRDTGLSYPTVRAHINAIHKGEWNATH